MNYVAMLDVSAVFLLILLSDLCSLVYFVICSLVWIVEAAFYLQ